MWLPRAMSTQHPDNATPPAFAENGVLMGEGEVEEACYVYGTLGCDEQMWDFEGKAADVDVVLKLLLKEPEYFRVKSIQRHLLFMDQHHTDAFCRGGYFEKGNEGRLKGDGDDGLRFSGIRVDRIQHRQEQLSSLGLAPICPKEMEGPPGDSQPPW